MLLRPDTLALTALLALLTAIGPLSVDLYLPSMPEIGRALAAPAGDVQLTISAFLIGFGIGQIVYGPVADRYGRKPVMTVALAIYCVAALACAATPSIAALIVARGLQAFGASGAIVLARAVVRDLYDGARAGRELSLMAMIMGLAPVVAPMIGGALQTAFGWRAGFIFMLLAGMIAITAVRLFLPETLRVPLPGSLAGIWGSYRVVARHRGAVAYLAIIAGAYGGLFAYISGSPFVLQTIHGLAPVEFGVAFAVASFGYLIGTTLAARLVTRWGLDRTIGWGALALAAGGVAMVAATALVPEAVIGVVLPMMVYLVGLGLTMPQAFAGALHPFPERAGAASSLIGFVQQSTAAVIGALVGQALGATAWPLALGVAIPGCFALMVWASTRKARAS
jgi:DHA1 family bicyclomycin/chloramphenicol resistance-like MFS transporter